MNTWTFRVALGCAALSTLACSSPRLGNAEIDRACELVARCAGGSTTTCVTELIDARAIADENGCASQFAAANRCYIRADSCSVTAACAEASDALVACSTTVRDTGPRDGGGVIIVADSGGDWVSAYNNENVAATSAVCAECPEVFMEGVCTGPLGLTPAQQDCIREVGNTYFEVRQFYECARPFNRVFNECLLNAARGTCPPDPTPCLNAYQSGVGTCDPISETANTALSACDP
jgi:hypothetical protein